MPWYLLKELATSLEMMISIFFYYDLLLNLAQQLKNPAASCSPPQADSTVRNSVNFLIRSLTPQSANPPEPFGGLADGECARCCSSICSNFSGKSNFKFTVYKFFGKQTMNEKTVTY